MSDVLWQASFEKYSETQMYAFLQKIAKKYNLTDKSYDSLHNWSTQHPDQFWEAVFQFSDIRFSKPYTKVLREHNEMRKVQWFEGLKFNFAENLIQRKDSGDAIVFYGENKIRKTYSFQQLNDSVRKAAFALRKEGIKKGDRIAAFMPNMPETIIFMLAAASIGAIWSSSSPDFGIQGVLDRFSQIEPKLILAADGYFFKGKAHDTQTKLAGILTKLPTVRKTVMVNYTGKLRIKEVPNAVEWDLFLDDNPDELVFEQVPFDHPLYIMYSSGTTGLPKSIVHSAGGTLLQHMKELRLHSDIRKDDRVFYFTTCGWMMWNWMVSSLAIGATLVLYDGNPFFPKPERLLNIAEKEQLSFFGTSAKYIAALQDANVIPKTVSDFPKLRVIASTGSPLSDESFGYVYEQWKTNVQLSSISGGTDIISCFVLGNPILPVRRGEIQCKGLGMDVDCWDEKGQSLTNEKGELVCKTAFPSMPVKFWNDPEGKKYHAAYFSEFPGVWHHGDFIEIRDSGGIIIHGRSDATLNPQGVRIGTAEIYRVLETFNEIEDSVVTGKKTGNDDENVILFVKMKAGKELDEKLVKNIKNAISEKCSPRHIPAVIKAVPDIPYTINGKKVELGVKKIIHGQDVKNRDALANPESLDNFRNLTLD
jgi:acetoacetyl-CoA synthetase